MDALSEPFKGGFRMSAYKDTKQGTWYVSFRYIDWTGKKTQKLKRGFKTKKEALNYEKEFIRKTAADMKLSLIHILPPLPEKIRNNDCQSAHAYDILVPASIV